MDRFADFPPVWEALGAKDGREYCRNRTRCAILRKRKMIKRAVQRSTRYSFIFRAVLKLDIPADALIESNWERLDVIGGSKLKRAKDVWLSETADVLRETDGPDDPRYKAALTRATAQYNAIILNYTRVEYAERRAANAMAMAARESRQADGKPVCIDEVLEQLDGQVFEVCEREIEEAMSYAALDAP